VTVTLDDGRTIDFSDTEAMRAEIQQPTEMNHWGEKKIVTPYLIDRVWGDGGAVFRIYPLSTRPKFYVFRGDSKWTDLNGDAFRDVIDEVQDEIEEQFGTIDDEDSNDPDFCVHDAWPRPDFTYGVGWGKHFMSDSHESETRWT
jgi:hypothetical protein